MTTERLGFGIDLSPLEQKDFRLGGLKEFLRRIPETEAVRRVADAAEDGIDALEEYERADGTRGFCAALADLIEETEGLRFEVFDEVRNGILYVPERSPWEWTEKEKNADREAWRRTAERYVSLIADDVPEFRRQTAFV